MRTTPDSTTPQTPVLTVAETAAALRFRTCRHRAAQTGGPDYCAHRDVVPFTGQNGFNPEAWCPECSFYKAKRSMKRRAMDAGWPATP